MSEFTKALDMLGKAGGIGTLPAPRPEHDTNASIVDMSDPNAPADDGSNVQSAPDGVGGGVDSNLDTQPTFADAMTSFANLMAQMMQNSKGSNVAPAVTQTPDAAGLAPFVPFSDETQFNTALSSPTEFNRVFGAQLNEWLQNALAAKAQEIAATIPKVSRNTVQVEMQNFLAVQKFQAENSDLAPVMQFVGVLANNLQAQNPSMSAIEVLNKAGLEARKMLNLEPKSQQPTQVNTPGARPLQNTQLAGNSNGQQKLIQDFFAKFSNEPSAAVVAS